MSEALQNVESAGLPGLWEQSFLRALILSNIVPGECGSDSWKKLSYREDRQPAGVCPAYRLVVPTFHSLFGNDQANLARKCMIALAPVLNEPLKFPNSTSFWTLYKPATDGLECITNDR